ncbi:MAG TPA: universal stress protein [Anaerolineales bacterium]|nr:universal stress protein [Anaerolineales bacterium]
MSEDTLQLLLCTNGEPASYPALEYGAWLAGLMGLPVVLLGIVEAAEKEERVTSAVESVAAELAERGAPYRVQFESGRGSVVISRLAAAGEFIVVVGPLGRPAWRRFVQGRSFRRIMARVESPIFYVRQSRTRLENILICMGGLGYSVSVQNLCLHLAKISHAKVTLLHVIEPVSFRYPISREVTSHWREVPETNTPQGRNLRRARQKFESAGIQVDSKIRRGNAVHEILEEIDHGEYDMVGLGSTYSAHSLRHAFLPNVTAEVAEAITCPVLTARYQPKTMPWQAESAMNHDTRHNQK